MKRLFTVMIISTFGVLLSFAALAGDANKEIATALAHAQMAAAADSLDMTHAHLHHVINCVVGEKGRGYDAKAEDPCKGMGAGALRDDWKNRAVRHDLEKAVAMAHRGIKTDKLDEAHKAAGEAADALKAAGGSK